MSDARRSQSRAVIAFVAVVTALGAAFAACTSYQRANGEDCLKDVDCISGFCVAQTCATPPTSLNGSSYGDGSANAPGADAGQESGASTPDSAPAADSAGGDSASDGPAAPVDSGPDSPHDASDAALLGDVDTFDAADGAEIDASDSSDGAMDLDANPDAPDAQDALNQMSRRRAFLA